ncbi:MAG: hypothetical protein WBD20_20635 [Pirellulaceae bacterium]
MKPTLLCRIAILLCVGLSCFQVTAAADEATLTQKQSAVASRYQRLEELLLRLADVEAAENPERSALLRRAARESRDKFVLEKLRKASQSLESQLYQDAVENQGAAAQDLQAILKLLMSEDRSKRIRDEKDRIAAMIKDLKRIERAQRSTRARTENGADLKEVESEQKSIAQRSKEVKEQISDSEEPAIETSDAKDGEEPDQENKDASGKPKDGQSKDGEKNDGEKKDGEKKDGEKKDGEKKDGELGEKDKEMSDKPDEKSKDGDKKDSDAKSGEDKQGESKDGELKDGKPQDGEPKDGKQQDGKPQEGQPQDGQQSQQDQQAQQTQSPEQEAEQQLQKAIEKMQKAQEELKQAQRENATQEQREAEEELRKAIDRLERILRQLREEEMQRELARLESRLRKMAAMQSKVLDDTTALSATPASQRNRQTDLKAGDLAFEEKKITLEADRAMLLLREEGSSVAFPEVVDQIRADTQKVAERLAETKIDVVTQGIQQDILAALEEMIAALQQAQRDLEKKQQQQQQGQQQQQQGEQPLVEALAELKLIRTMERRIKSTTDRYSGLLESGESETGEVLPLLQNLAERQNRLYRITRDLVLKRNK